ncbi:MAG: ABC transporter permease, partial [bacterium]|nr:ABC transporter permease [bacterium]
MSTKKKVSIKAFFFFLSGVFRNRKIIKQLVKRDLQQQNLGSFLGIAWTFIQPLMFTLAIWFVFSIGLKGGKLPNDYPFVLWLMSGMFLWFFFSECLSGGANSILKNAYLVKKMVFRISMLPVVKLLSSMVIHSFFLLLLLVLNVAYGYMLDLYCLQLLYYLFATFALTLGFAWFTSSLVLFFRDLQQIIQIVCRVGF